MCDNPNKDPWEVYIDPEIIMRILLFISPPLVNEIYPAQPLFGP